MRSWFVAEYRVVLPNRLPWLLTVAGLLLIGEAMLGRAAIGPPVYQNLAPGAEMLEDPDGRLTLAEVLALPAGSWARPGQPVLNPGYTTSVWWVRFTLDNDEGATRERWLEVGWPLLDWLEAWVMDGDTVVAAFQSGDQRPFASRPLATRTFVFPLDLPARSRRVLLLRLAMRDGVYDVIPLRLWEPAAYFQAVQRTNLWAGMYFGALLALFAYNTLLFLTTRDRHFFRYALYLAAVALWNQGYLGYGYQYLWPDHSWWNNQVNISLSGLTLLAATHFVTHYLDTRGRMPWLDKSLRVTTLMLLATMMIALADTLGWAVPVAGNIAAYVLLTCLLALMYLAAGLRALWLGFREARYFVLAWSCLVLGMIIYALTAFPEVLPRTVLTENSLNLGSLLECLLLALALGDRYKQLRDKQLALESQNRLALEAYSHRLEQEVEARTRELRTTVAQLDMALRNEQRAQAEQRTFLTTVAHELRTPLTVIDVIAQNLELDRLDADDQTRRRYERILQATGRLSHVLNQYLDEERMKAVLHDAMEEVECDPLQLLTEVAEAARLLANGQWLRVETADLPPTWRCDPTLTRLALMNLADNAVKYTPPATRVILSGGEADGGLWLAVKDDGAGLAADELERLFSPHQRGANASGRPGQGMGLALARRMIERQGGTLTGTSTPGQGCSFRIWLPLGRAESSSEGNDRA